MQKNGVFVSVTVGRESLSVRIMVTGVVFRNHHDRNALADKLDLIAPVLFERDPRMGFEPEGNDKQFNRSLLKWLRHNVAGRTGHEDYRITRPDVDHHREGSERYYRDYIAANSNDDASLPLPGRINAGTAISRMTCVP